MSRRPLKRRIAETGNPYADFIAKYGDPEIAYAATIMGIDEEDRRYYSDLGFARYLLSQIQGPGEFYDMIHSHFIFLERRANDTSE